MFPFMNLHYVFNVQNTYIGFANGFCSSIQNRTSKMLFRPESINIEDFQYSKNNLIHLRSLGSKCLKGINVMNLCIRSFLAGTIQKEMNAKMNEIDKNSDRLPFKSETSPSSRLPNQGQLAGVTHSDRLVRVQCLQGNGLCIVSGTYVLMAFLND